MEVSIQEFPWGRGEDQATAEVTERGALEDEDVAGGGVIGRESVLVGAKINF